MIIEILFVVAMFLWFLTSIPFAPLEPYARAQPLLAFVCVLLLGIQIYAGRMLQ
jgi:hypothetical protein